MLALQRTSKRTSPRSTTLYKILEVAGVLAGFWLIYGAGYGDYHWFVKTVMCGIGGYTLGVLARNQAKDAHCHGKHEGRIEGYIDCLSEQIGQDKVEERLAMQCRKEKLPDGTRRYYLRNCEGDEAGCVDFPPDRETVCSP